MLEKGFGVGLKIGSPGDILLRLLFFVRRDGLGIYSRFVLTLGIILMAQFFGNINAHFYSADKTLTIFFMDIFLAGQKKYSVFSFIMLTTVYKPCKTIHNGGLSGIKAHSYMQIEFFYVF